MITRTYVDGKFSDLENRLVKKIETKVNTSAEKLDAEISELKSEVKRACEKSVENKDVLYEYLENQNHFKEKLELLESRMDKIKKIISDKFGTDISSDEEETIKPDVIK